MSRPTRGLYTSLSSARGSRDAMSRVTPSPAEIGAGRLCLREAERRHRVILAPLPIPRHSSHSHFDIHQHDLPRSGAVPLLPSASVRHHPLPSSRSLHHPQGRLKRLCHWSRFSTPQLLSFWSSLARTLAVPCDYHHCPRRRHAWLYYHSFLVCRSSRFIALFGRVWCQYSQVICSQFQEGVKAFPEESRAGVSRPTLKK
jgi:hypothetical protein